MNILDRLRDNKKLLVSILVVFVIIVTGSIIYISYRLNQSSSDTRSDAAYATAGWLDYVSCDNIYGWAWDPDAPDTSISVHIYMDGPAGTGIFVMDAVADHTRRDLVDHTKDNTKHGYFIETPALLKDGNPHTVYVHGIDASGGDANALLEGVGGETITCNPPSVSGDAVIQNTALGSTLSIKTTSRLAGAIDSLVWNDKEFVNSYDHGRQIQYAMFLNGLGECYNPTEAGSERNGVGVNTTSKLLSIKADGNVLSTLTKMAFWKEPDQITGNIYCSGGASEPFNDKALSDMVIEKKVTIGSFGMDNVVKLEAKARIPVNDGLTNLQIEAPTGYLMSDFDRFYRYDPKADVISEVSYSKEGRSQVEYFSYAKEGDLPVIISTQDGNYAIGVYSSNLANEVGSRAYGLFYFPSNDPDVASAKWNIVFRRGQTNGGKTIDYTSYLAVGTLEDVRQSLKTLYLESPSDLYFPSGNVEVANCSIIRGWAWDADSPDEPISVHLFADGPAGTGSLVADSLANRLRPDLETVTFDNTQHGFLFDFPDSLKDGKDHKIYIQGSNTDYTRDSTVIMGSEMVVNCTK